MKKLISVGLGMLALVAQGETDKFAAAFEKIGGENPELVLYLDMEGDVAQVGTWLSELYAGALAANPEAMPIPLNFNAIFARMGLTALDHALLTSVAREDLQGYLNQAMIRLSEEPSGLLALFGTENMTFEYASRVPADADVVGEFQFRPNALVSMIRAIAQDVMGDTGTGLVDMQLAQPLNEAGLTIGGVIEMLDTRYAMVANVDPEGAETESLNLFGMPGDQVWIIEGAAALPEAIAPLLFGLVPMGKIENDPYDAWKIEIEVPESNSFILLLNALPGSEDLMISSGERAREWYLGERSGLATDADFTALATELPREGLAFTYASKTGSEASLKQLEGMLDDPEMEQMAPVMGALLTMVEGFVGRNASAVWIEDNTLRSKAIQPYSTKAAFGVVAVAAPAMMAAMAIPAFQKVQATSEEKTVTNNLRQIMSAGQQYMLETGAEEVTYLQIIEAGYFPPLEPVAGESYEDIVIGYETTEISVTLDDGRVISYSF